MNHKQIAISCLFFLSSLPVFSQEKRQLNLDDAINLSINNSKLLKLNQAKIDEAMASVKAAEDNKLPNASVSGSYLRLGNANVDMKTANNNPGNGGGGSKTPEVSQALYGMLNLSMPLYTGGKIKYGIESAKYLTEAVKLDAEDDKDELIQNTIEAFANLYKANTAVMLMKENLQAAKQRVTDLTNLEKNGLLARNDLLKAELQASNVEQNLLDADNNLQFANLNMNLMLGFPNNTQLVLDTVGIEKRDEGDKVLNDYISEALQSRKDLKAISFRKKAAVNGVKSVNAEKYPGLQVSGGYIAADIPNLITITNAMNIGLGISYNVSSLWKLKSKVQQAEAKVKQVTLNEAMMNDNITLQVSKAYLSLMSSRKKIEVSELAMNQAKENYRIVKNKFDNSLATTTELLDADAAQLQATLGYTLTRADAYVAYNKLLQVSGILASSLKK